MADFPTSVDGVTNEWLTGVLRGDSGMAADDAVLGFEVEPIGVGVGLMGLLYRLSLSYEGSGGPETVVLKVPVPHDGTRHVARTFRFYEKEVGFYRDLAEHSPFGTATCHVARHDPEHDDFVLLLGDITEGEILSQIDGCPPGPAEIAVRALARHHAAFADDERFDRPELSWLPFGHEPPNPQGVTQGVTDSWGPFQEGFPELIDDDVAAIVPAYVRDVGALMAPEPGRPITLIHGDYRLDNLFFEADGGLTVIDWQICGKGAMAYDLAYFLTQSLTVADRRASEASLIDAYLEELAANGVEDDRDRFMDDYRRTVLFCICYPLQAGGQIELANDRARALVVDMFERSMAAIRDHDATEFLPT